MREPTSPFHERPSVRLARMIDRIAVTSGADMEILGTSDLLLRDADGNRHRIMQADQIVYTHKARTRPQGDAVEVSADELPDVVLEVDLTTDVRRGKLWLYEAWGFREIWVEVPEHRAKSSPNREPGLTIHLLGKDGYVEVPTSFAFPTWTAAEIHAGLNEERTIEKPLSDATAAVLRRVGRVYRKTTGKGPDHDPFLRMERAESRAEGHATGYALGRANGLEVMLRGIFELRGLSMSAGFEDIVAAHADLPGKVLAQAATECHGEIDFVRRIREASVQ